MGRKLLLVLQPRFFICWWFEQSEKKSSLIANLWPYHFTENLWVHFMHNGESLGGDFTLSYRVRKHSYLTTFVSPCFPHGCQSKTISMQCRLSRLSNVHHANVKIWGKFVQDFCPNIVQLQHSPTLCPCDTGTIPKCLFFAHNFFSFTFKEWITKCLIPKCLFAHGFFSLTFKRRLLLNP